MSSNGLFPVFRSGVGTRHILKSGTSWDTPVMCVLGLLGHVQCHGFSIEAPALPPSSPLRLVPVRLGSGRFSPRFLASFARRAHPQLHKYISSGSGSLIAPRLSTCPHQSMKKSLASWPAQSRGREGSTPCIGYVFMNNILNKIEISDRKSRLKDSMSTSIVERRHLEKLSQSM